VCGWQVKLCDPLVTHVPYLSALEVQHDKALYESTFTLLYLLRACPTQGRNQVGDAHVQDSLAASCLSDECQPVSDTTRPGYSHPTRSRVL